MSSGAQSLRMIALEAQQWQAFWGIIFGAVTLGIFIWATYKNQKRQDEKFKEWKRLNDTKDKD